MNCPNVIISAVNVLLGFSSVDTIAFETALADGNDVREEDDNRGMNTPSSYALSRTLFKMKNDAFNIFDISYLKLIFLI